MIGLVPGERACAVTSWSTDATERSTSLWQSGMLRKPSGSFVQEMTCVQPTEHGPECWKTHPDCAARKVQELQQTVVYLSTQLARLTVDVEPVLPAFATVACRTCGWSVTWDPASGPQFIDSGCPSCQVANDDEEDEDPEDVSTLDDLTEFIRRASPSHPPTRPTSSLYWVWEHKKEPQE